MTDTRVLVLVGSLRADSYNRRLAEALAAHAPAGAAVELATGLDQLPFYSEDLDGTDAATTPASVVAFRATVAAADRVLIVTPEYNGSMPAVIKNALDWASRPFGNGSLKGTPLAVIGTSVGQYGGKWAHDDVRRSAGVAGATVVEDISVSHAYPWGTNPTEDAEVLKTFVAALTDLVAVEESAAA